MRMTKGLLLALICAPSLLVSAQNDTNSGVQSKVIALEKAWHQAYKLGDTRALEEILDDRIVLINDDGSIQTKAEFIASVQPAKSQEQQVAPESMSVRVFGNTAIATGMFRAKGVESGRPYARRERFVDTWLNKAGKWSCIATNATPVLH